MDLLGFGFVVFVIIRGRFCEDQRAWVGEVSAMELECETLDFQLQLDSTLLNFKEQNRV